MIVETIIGGILDIGIKSTRNEMIGFIVVCIVIWAILIMAVIE